MNNINFSFDDEIAEKIEYNDIKKTFEIYFDAYYDMNKSHLIERKCVLYLCNWTKVFGKLWSDKKYEDDWNLSLFVSLFKVSNVFMILSLNIIDNDLYITFDLGTETVNDYPIAHIYDVCFKDIIVNLKLI